MATNIISIFKKIWQAGNVIVMVIMAVFAVFGVIAIGKKLKKKDEGPDPVKPDEIKPGTTVVPPSHFDPKPNNPLDNNYEITAPDKEKIPTPIPDNKIDEIIRPDVHVVDIKPKHENKSDNLLDKIRKLKNG